MKEDSPRRVQKFVLLVIITIAVYSVALMALWNWLMPAIFDQPRLTYWQALGLLGLSRILFGGLRVGRRIGWRHRQRKEAEPGAEDSIT